jgi:hypothetical protein
MVNSRHPDGIGIDSIAGNGNASRWKRRKMVSACFSIAHFARGSAIFILHLEKKGLAIRN